MKTGTFITEIDNEVKISIPPEIKERLQLSEGDKVEILLKKIRSKRLDLSIGKNPLTKIIKLSEATEI
jgi:bifunctional DNA-binding transcriptional regulator/antitoxin component of YhaV-PrlF toxin-antitoxin module